MKTEQSGIRPIQIHLDIGMYKLLERYCYEKNLSKSEVVRISIEKYLKGEKTS